MVLGYFLGYVGSLEPSTSHSLPPLHNSETLTQQMFVFYAIDSPKDVFQAVMTVDGTEMKTVKEKG